MPWHESAMPFSKSSGRGSLVRLLDEVVEGGPHVAHGVDELEDAVRKEAEARGEHGEHAQGDCLLFDVSHGLERAASRCTSLLQILHQM